MKVNKHPSQTGFKHPARSVAEDHSPVPEPRPVWLLMLVLVCLLPFINKAVHIDDTLFLRAAQQIQKHPLDFYGFRMKLVRRGRADDPCF